MQEIIIATSNPYKQEKLKDIVSVFFVPKIINKLEPIEECGKTFKEIAENKAKGYSLKYRGLAISTDGGAIIPSLSAWEPLRTRRFGSADEERIISLLKLMEGKKDRKVEWHESLAVAQNGKLLFSAQEKAIDGNISEIFDPQKYQKGIWLCSITDFPDFGNRNYFDLTPDEKLQTEDSWGKLKNKFNKFAIRYVESCNNELF